jgi:CHAD domain-containing protein
LPSKKLVSVYYDTATYRLAHAKITLRRRKENGKEVWQLKLPLEKGRREIELVGGETAPPRSAYDLLVVHLQGERLEPVATLRTWRSGIRVGAAGGGGADVVLDTVSVLKNKRAIQSFREVEIERLNGDDALVARLEQTLRRAGAEDHDGRPKLFRALKLPPPHPLEPPGYESPVIDHLKFVLSQHVEALLSHDPGVRYGGDSEDVHQMRVATRRLRAVLRAAKPFLLTEWVEPLRAELKWIGNILGTARDLDVQSDYFRHEAEGLEIRDRKPLEQFVEHLHTRRHKVQDALLSELRSARYLDLVHRLQQAAQDPAMVLSTMTLQDIAAKEFKKLRKAIRHLKRSPSDHELHRIRIRAKRARYAAELTEAYTGKAATRFMDEVKTFQDTLGMHQDAVQAEKHIRSFVNRSKGTRVAFVAGRMVERQRQRRAEVRSAFRGQWKKLNKRGKKAWK